MENRKQNNLNPLVSVLIPVYNSEKYIGETIDSVLEQTFPDFELLLLDDGSEDKTAEIISGYTDERIKYILCPHDFINTLNRGIDLAKGKYIALLDHDDLMMPDRLKMQYKYMEGNLRVAVCGGYMQSFGMYSRVMRVPLSYRNVLKAMVFDCPVMNPTGFIRKSFLVEHGLRYSQGYSFAADLKLWTDIARVGEIVNLPEILTRYRTYPEQTSRKCQAEMDEAADRIHLDMVEYFLDLVKEDSVYYPILMDNFLPALDKLGESGFFSSRTLLYFLYELISGLIDKGELRLESQKNALPDAFL